MSTHAGSASNAAITKSRSCRETVRFKAVVAIGSTGAPTQGATVNGDPGYDDPAITVTRTSQGLYALTYPKGRRAFIRIGLYSPLLTVVGSVVTALSASAGTASFTTLAGSNAAAVTDPASGDVLYLDIEVVP
jgi:hypothetical protein